MRIFFLYCTLYRNALSFFRATRDGRHPRTATSRCFTPLRSLGVFDVLLSGACEILILLRLAGRLPTTPPETG